MAHNVTANDKGVMAHTGAWHNLFAVVAAFLTPSEAFKAAGLGWLVKLVDLFVTGPDGSPLVVPGIKAVQREDTGAVFGTVTENYNPLQNSTLLEAIEAIFGATSQVIEAAFSLFGGKKVVMLVNMGAAKIALALAGKTVEDAHVSYLLFTTAHDGKGGWSILPTATRVQCDNTLKAAEGEDGEILKRDGITIRHSSKASERIADAVEAYQKAIAAGRLTLNRIQKIANVRITRAAKTAYYRTMVDNTLAPVSADDKKAAENDAEKAKAIARREARREELYASFLKWEAFEAAAYVAADATEVDNAYLIYNAVSSSFEHDSHFRKSDGATASENEFVSRVYGKISDQKEEAVLLMEAVIKESGNVLASILASDSPVSSPSVLDSILAEA